MKFSQHIFIFFCLFLAVQLSSGRVWRVIGDRHGRLNVTGLPWATAYKTEMTISGVKNEVVVYSARYTQSVVDQLKNQFELQGARVTLRKTNDGATGIASWADCEARFLVLSPVSQPTHTIFIFYPESGKADCPASLPFPFYKNGEVVQSVSDDKSETYLVMIKTNDSSTDVHSYYAKTLLSEGWSLVVPARVADGSIRGMATYQKKNRICYVQSRDRVGQKNLITLLVKVGTL